MPAKKKSVVNLTAKRMDDVLKFTLESNIAHLKKNKQEIIVGREMLSPIVKFFIDFMDSTQRLEADKTFTITIQTDR